MPGERVLLRRDMAETVTLMLEYASEREALRAVKAIRSGLRGDARVMEFDGICKEPSPVSMISHLDDPHTPIGYAVYITGPLDK